MYDFNSNACPTRLEALISRSHSQARQAQQQQQQQQPVLVCPFSQDAATATGGVASHGGSEPPPSCDLYWDGVVIGALAGATVGAMAMVALSVLQAARK